MPPPPMVIYKDFGICRVRRIALCQEDVQGEVERFLAPVDDKVPFLLEFPPCREVNDELLIAAGPAQEKAVREEAALRIRLCFSGEGDTYVQGCSRVPYPMRPARQDGDGRQKNDAVRSRDPRGSLGLAERH